MSDNEEENAQCGTRPAKRKLLRKRANRDDIFSYRNQIPLSFRAKQVKIDDSDSSDSEDDDAFHRVLAEGLATKDSKERESDSDGEEDIWITNERSLEETDSSTSDVKERSFNRSPSPPPCPTLSAAALTRLNQRQAGNRELDNILANLKRSTANSWSSPDTHRPSSVISVDSLDDSYGLPSPSERNIVVKVRTRSGIRRFTMKAAEPFGKIISQLAEQEGLTEDKIMLSLKDINIVGYDTPMSVKLSVADIIECVIVKTPLMTDSTEEEEANKINIKVQGNDADSKKTFQVLKTEPLEKLMKAYCEFRRLKRSKLKFVFDGDVLSGSETPVDLDMEDEDVIDVRVK